MTTGCNQQPTVPGRTVHYDGEYGTNRIGGKAEIRFPITASASSERGTQAQLKNIEVSPFGLHSPDLDEDLSFRVLLTGEFRKDAFAVPRKAVRSLHRQMDITSQLGWVGKLGVSGQLNS